ncbi:MAG: DUF2851 family protein [Dehalococcoidia bacterium]|nr:DUF2851 family protein [Dehalococcoidia bacterium]
MASTPPVARHFASTADPDGGLTERDLSRLWYEEGFHRRGLRTRCGRTVRVLYRGMPNRDCGPDYRGAVLSLGRGRPKTGDIELHVRSRHWHMHGHDRDPRYDGVILHVVWQDDDPNPTRLHSGRRTPVLALGGFTLAGKVSPVAEPCGRSPGLDLSWLEQVLDRAGEVRFLGKASRMEGDMAAVPAQEVLYQSLSEAMGYSRNKAPFRRLATVLPLGILEGFLWGRPPELREEVARALLMGTAGLLPSQGGRPAPLGFTGPTEEVWRSCGVTPQMDHREWYFGVRAENHPVRRLAALASIVAATLKDGLVSWALEAVGTRTNEPGRDREPATRGVASFPVPRALFRRLVGPDRALEIMANVLLPFVYSYGQAKGEEWRSEAALERYALLPSPASNQVTRHMMLQVLGSSTTAIAGTARRQQGMLHLFHSYCTRARCTECGLSCRTEGPQSV